MKKQILSILFSGLALASFAQSFSVSGPRTIFELNTTNKGKGKYTFFNFETAKEIAGADSATTKWDIAFSGTTILLNGGTSGPGTVSGQILTSTSFLEETSAPANGYVVDGTTKAIPTGSGKGWYQYNGQGATGPHTVVPLSGRVIAIKLADGRYVKLEILNYYQGVPDDIPTTIGEPTYEVPSGYYSFRYLLSESGSSDWSQEITKITNLYANLPGGHYNLFDLATGDTILTADSLEGKWDVAFYSTTIKVNGGTSGPANTEAQIVEGNFDNIIEAPSMNWGTVISSWYDYNMTSHVIVPKSDRVILVKTSNGRYVKIKIESYYKDNNTANLSRYYTISYYFQPNGSTDLETRQKITSISGSASKSDFKIYPNPVHSEQSVSIEFNETKNAVVTIYNTQGIRVNSFEATNGLIKNVQLLPGMYILSVETEGKTAQQKLIVE